MEGMEQTGSKNEAMAARSIFDTEYLSPDSLAKNLGVSVRTLARWHSLRTGPAITRVGRMILYRRESVSEWLRSCELEHGHNGASRTRRSRRLRSQ
jgi:hypothetical protein